MGGKAKEFRGNGLKNKMKKVIVNLLRKEVIIMENDSEDIFPISEPDSLEEMTDDEIKRVVRARFSEWCFGNFNDYEFDITR